ncbi:class I SAM-dependent methyltransferase [Paenibacillus sp. MBLB4367]|uniref:class I SAM-dependent methyltransferase n=1 Tax=Paenibacillus sp. MBLB4367 TaxID=3384767 RepID=UPI0039080FE3
MNTSIKRDLLESYDRNASLRDRSVLEKWKIDEMNMFLSYVGEEKRPSLLDFGAGAGHSGKFFQERGLDVTCADLSPEMVKACANKGLKARVSDFYSPGFEKGAFDAVWAMNSLLHVPKADLLTVLRGISRILKEDGLFYMGVYGGSNSEGVWEADTYEPKRFFAFYETEALKAKVGEVFDVVRADIVPIEGTGPDFQSFVLRKRGSLS